MKKKSVVMLSGGLDSAVNLAWAAREHEVARAVTFDYGQRAAARETQRALGFCRHYGISLELVKLPSLAAWTRTALVARAAPLPRLSPADLDRREAALESARAVWVPNRNGIFINVAAALAENLEAAAVVVGFNAEEGATFPDNSAEFVEAANRSLFFSTLNHVEVISRTVAMNKREIVRLGKELGLPFQLLWSCYEGGERMCGSCESCLRLKRAVRDEAPDLLEVLDFAD